MPGYSKTPLALAFLAGALALSPLSPSAATQAPDFELPDLGGKNISLSGMLRENKVVVLSFFGSWCESCFQEISDLPEMVANHDVRVYLVGLDAEKNKLERAAEKHKIPFPILWDPKAKTLGRKYDLLRGAFLVVPKTFIISPAGVIEYSAESYDEERRLALREKLGASSVKKWDQSSEVAVYFTGSANGYLESCNCYKHPYGGFIKLVSLLKQQADKFPNRIVVDAGDFLPYGTSSLQAGPIFKALASAGYDAIAVGDQDLHYGDFLNEAKAANLPLLASNLRSGEGLPWASDKVLTIGDLKIRIVSYIGREAFSLYPDEFSAKQGIKDLKKVLAGGKNSDVLILLSHAGLDENKKIAAKFGQVDLIISGHSQELLTYPIKIGNTLIVQSGGNLQNLGRIVLRFDAKKKLRDSSYEILPLTNDIPNSPEVEAIIKESRVFK